MTITIEYDGSCATCEVSDNGKRLQLAYADALTRQRVFDAFHCIKTCIERDKFMYNP